ncbi:hypothetical protein [Arthrobacter methylotrophus]|uniref:Uncharacterized protein n=1 Tax=Arthrobacter methylotrophus TaxID=121291 RepID=A0ABV5UNX3_9MICC
MSTTFSAVPGPVTGFAISCVHGPTDHLFESYPAVQEFLQAELDAHGGTGHLAGCGNDFCAAMRMSIEALEADPSPRMRVSNSNGGALASLLGYPADGYSVSGSDTAEVFRDRVLAAQSTNSDSGYTADRLVELLDIAEFCAARGRDVQWA